MMHLIKWSKTATLNDSDHNESWMSNHPAGVATWVPVCHDRESKLG